MKTIKTLVLTVSFLVIGFTSLNAQTQIGAGFLVSNGINAIEAKANFGVTDQIDISPSVGYFLGTENYSAFIITADGHYNFEAGDAFKVYPLAGLNYFVVSGDG